VLVQTTLAELLLLLKWGKFKGSKGGRVEYCSVRGALVCVCREFLRKYKHARAAQGLADFPAVQLREAIVASGLVLYCKGVFIQASTGNAGYDPLRSLIISLLQVPR
jgi:hypothetical protein